MGALALPRRQLAPCSVSLRFAFASPCRAPPCLAIASPRSASRCLAFAGQGYALLRHCLAGPCPCLHATSQSSAPPLPPIAVHRGALPLLHAASQSSLRHCVAVPCVAIAQPRPALPSLDIALPRHCLAGLCLCGQCSASAPHCLAGLRRRRATPGLAGPCLARALRGPASPPHRLAPLCSTVLMLCVAQCALLCHEPPSLCHILLIGKPPF